MDHLKIGEIVQNSPQKAVVRWLGSADGIPLVGLETISATLPGYTDGICPIDNQRYFRCPDGRGYYVLRSTFIQSYTIVSRDPSPTDRFTATDSSSSASNARSSTVPQPTASSSSPIASRNQPSLDTTRPASLSRGVLSRLAPNREHRHFPEPPTASEAPGADPSSPPRRYHPDNYRSVSWEAERDASTDPRASQYDAARENIPRSQPIENLTLSSFGHEYFLDRWTLGQVVSLLQVEIPLDNQFCLHSHNDQCNVQMLVDEQINASASLIPETPPSDICVELIKIFDHVKSIFPSRAIRLHDHDYLLLAILCSNNQCAYVRTRRGWAYTDDDNEQGSSFLVNEISQMINAEHSDTRHVSEQCQHILKNAAFLYYKLVQ